MLNSMLSRAITLSAILLVLTAPWAVAQEGCYFGVCPGDPGTEFPTTPTVQLPPTIVLPPAAPPTVPTGVNKKSTGKQTPVPGPERRGVRGACLAAFGQNGEFSWEPTMGLRNALAVCEAALRDQPDDQDLKFNYAAARDMFAGLDGSPADDYFATATYRDLSLSGHAFSKYALATMYDEDAGISTTEAGELLRDVLASNTGNALACLSAGMMLKSQPNLGAEVAGFWQILVDGAARHPTCSTVMASIGRSLPWDQIPKNFAWFPHTRATAVQGDSWGMFSLGYLYIDGWDSQDQAEYAGVPEFIVKDTVRAGNWIILAYFASLRHYKPGNEIFSWDVHLSIENTAKAIQTSLKTLGLYDGAIDGEFGAKSRAALERFVASDLVDPLFQQMRASEPVAGTAAVAANVHLGDAALALLMQ